MINKFSKISIDDGEKKHLFSLFLSLIFICVMPFLHPNLIFIPFFIQIFRMLVYSHEITLMDFAVLLPFSNLFRLPDGKSLLFVLVLVANIWFFYKRKMKINKGLLIIFLVLIYLFFRMGEKYTDYLSIISGLVFLYFVVDILTPDISVRISKMFVMSVLLSAIWGWLFRDSRQMAKYLGNTENNMFDIENFRFQALFTDPNYFSVCVILAICFLFLLYLSGHIKALWLYIGSGLLAVFGIITLSKTFFIVFVICVIAYLLTMFKRKYLYVCLAFCLVIGIVWILFRFGKIEALQALKERFDSAQEFNDLTTGRSDLWRAYFQKTLETVSSFLFGYGFEAPLLENLGSHNLFLEIFYYTGIFGLIGLIGFFVWVFCATLKKHLCRNEFAIKYASVFIMLFAFVAFYWSLQGVYQSMLYIEIALVAMGFVIPFSREGDGNE